MNKFDFSRCKGSEGIYLRVNLGKIKYYRVVYN